METNQDSRKISLSERSPEEQMEALFRGNDQFAETFDKVILDKNKKG